MCDVESAYLEDSRTGAGLESQIGQDVQGRVLEGEGDVGYEDEEEDN